LSPSIRQHFFYDDYQIGLIFEPLDQFIAEPEKFFDCIKWLVKPFKKSQMSQAFLSQDAYGHRIFFTFNHAGKRMIYSTEEKTGFDLYHLALASDHNHCFPGVFVYGNTLFCLPATLDSDQLFLFTFDAGSHKLTPFKMLLEGYEGLFPNIFRHNGLWWLMCYTISDNKHWMNLFWSDDIQASFTPHAKNPIEVDEPLLIPAGPLIYYNEKLLLPMANPADNISSIELHEVLSLTSEDFSTKFMKRITAPERGNMGGGLVHLSGNEHYTVISARRSVFTWSGFFKNKKI
jgi:hypothetical protein